MALKDTQTGRAASPSSQTSKHNLCFCSQDDKDHENSSGKCWLCVGSAEKSSTLNRSLVTTQQHLIIHQTWQGLSANLTRLGISSMNKLLELDKTATLTFGFLGKAASALRHDLKFRRHALWLMQAISATVENLYSMDETLSETFIDIGEKHAAVPFFQKISFQTLPAAWSRVWEDALDDRCSQHTKQAWQKLFDYISERLIEGYENGLKEKKISVSSSTVESPPTSAEEESSTTTSMSDSEGLA